MYRNRSIDLNLDTAKERKVFGALGYIVQFSETNNPSEPITVELKHADSGSLSGPFRLFKNDKIEVPSIIEQVLITHGATTGGNARIDVINVSKQFAPTQFNWVQNERGVVDSVVNAIKNKSGNTITTPPPVDVGTTVTLIAEGNTDVNFREFQNHGSSDVWLGDADVSTSNRAILVKPGGSYEINSGGAMYGIRASGSGDVAIVEVD